MNKSEKLLSLLEGKPKVVVYDNGGKTADRYTVVIGTSVFGMSDDATTPNGFNQYAGETSEYPRGFTGKKVKVTSLPKQTQKAIEDRMKEE